MQPKVCEGLKSKRKPAARRRHYPPFAHLPWTSHVWSNGPIRLATGRCVHSTRTANPVSQWILCRGSRHRAQQLSDPPYQFRPAQPSPAHFPLNEYNLKAFFFYSSTLPVVCIRQLDDVPMRYPSHQTVKRSILLAASLKRYAAPWRRACAPGAGAVAAFGSRRHARTHTHPHARAPAPPAPNGQLCARQCITYLNGID